jgi:hypothetical protein
MVIDRPAEFERVAAEFLASLRARGEAGWVTPFDPPTDPRLHFAGGGIDSGPPATGATHRLPLAPGESWNAGGAPAASLSSSAPVS